MKYIATENVPDWAIQYLEYGDPTGLTEEETTEIETWLNENFPTGYVCEYLWDGEGFYRSPLWGLATNCVPTNFYQP